MSRISRQTMWMDMAEVAAKRSTCFRGNVGALIVLGNNVLSIGYNGPQAGETHCTGRACELTPEGGCARSVHAEANAISRAQPRHLRGCDIYCTSSPCPMCARLIKNADILRVFYRTPYRIDTGLRYLNVHGVLVYQVTTGGFIIDRATQELISEDVL